MATAEEVTEIKGNRVDMTTTAVETDSEEVVVSVAEVTIVIETLEVMARILDGKITTVAAAAIKVVDIKEAVVVDTTGGEEDNHMEEVDHPFMVAEMEVEGVEVIMIGVEAEDMDQRRMPWVSMVMIARTLS